MMDEIVRLLQRRYGADWTRNREANLHFVIEAEHLLQDVEGAHLIGDPAVEDGEVTLTLWVDEPICDLMDADQLAYDVFARLSAQIFYTERLLEAKSLRYRFVTGSPSHGHVGTLVLAGPHAADFTDLHRYRMTGGQHYHA